MIISPSQCVFEVFCIEPTLFQLPINGISGLWSSQSIKRSQTGTILANCFLWWQRSKDAIYASETTGLTGWFGFIAADLEMVHLLGLKVDIQTENLPLPSDVDKDYMRSVF